MMKKQWIKILLIITFILTVLLIISVENLLISNGLQFFGALNEVSPSSVETLLEILKGSDYTAEGISVLNDHGYRYSGSQLFFPSRYRILLILLFLSLILLCISIFFFYHSNRKETAMLKGRAEETDHALKSLQEEYQSTISKISEHQGNIYHQLASSLSSVQIVMDQMEEDDKENRSLKEAQYNVNNVNCLLKLLMKEEKYLEKKQNFNHLDFCMTELMEEVIHECKLMIDFYDIKITSKLEDDVIYKGDDVWMKECLLSLLTNSIEHAGENGSVSIILKKISNWVRIEIFNNGIPLKEEQKEHMFERYYSSKAGHMGIGMHMANSIVEIHHGTLELFNETNGVKISVLLPIFSGKDAYLS